MNNTEQDLSVQVREEQVNVREYKPSNLQCLREYEVSIRFLSRGCIVRVGCKEIAFENVGEAIKELNEYVNNTYDIQRKWCQILE